MDFKKIADHFRTDTAPLSVSQVVIITGEDDFVGNGKFRRVGDELELEVTLAGEQLLPAVRGMYTREQFWKIGGIIEGQTPFWAVGLPRQRRVNQARFVVRSGQFHFDRINHLTAPFEMEQLREAVIHAANAERESGSTPVRGYVNARLTDYKLVWCQEMTVTTETNPFLKDSEHTERNTLMGKVGAFEYGLIQRSNDCDIHLRLKEGSTGQVGTIGRVAHAMYRALAFVHGRHAWPQWERVDIGNGKHFEYTTAPKRVSDNKYTPLTETTSNFNSDSTVLISKATELFLREDAFSEKFAEYLFLTRQAAGEETPVEVGTLGLCAVLEGFVSFLHQHFLSSDVRTDGAEFEQAKSVLADFMKKQTMTAAETPRMTESWKRLSGLIQSARPLRPADKYEQLVTHFGLPPEKMLLALEAWKLHRHPLAHGVSANDDLMGQLIATSRIAGAINVLAAATLGFSGRMVLSRIEDKYIQLP